MKCLYSLYIDGKLAYEANHIGYLKEKAQFEFDYLNAFSATIVRGNQYYAYKKYDGNWIRMSGKFKKESA